MVEGEELELEEKEGIWGEMDEKIFESDEDNSKESWFEETTETAIEEKVPQRLIDRIPFFIFYPKYFSYFMKLIFNQIK